MTLNSTINGESVKYRIFISEVGTTVSKVREPIYVNDMQNKICIFEGLLWSWSFLSRRTLFPPPWYSLCKGDCHKQLNIESKIIFKASEKFRQWNDYNKICLFPNQKELRFFSSYFQDNCKRECSWNRFEFARSSWINIFFVISQTLEASPSVDVLQNTFIWKVTDRYKQWIDL